MHARGDADLARALLVIVETGELLLLSGAGAAEVVATMGAVADAYSLPECVADVTSTSLMVSYRSSPETLPITEVRLVGEYGLDYARLRSAHRLVAGIRAGVVGPEAALAALDRMRSSPPPYKPWLVTLAFAVTGASFTLMLGGGAVVFAAAFTTTIVVELLNRWLSGRRVQRFYQCVLGGALSTVVATLLQLTELTTQSSLVVVGGIVVLLPGLAFVAGVQDAIAGYFITASARILDAAIQTFAIVGGVGVALYGAVQCGVHVPLAPFAVRAAQEWQQFAFIGVAAAAVCVGFATVTQSSPKLMLSSGITGAIGWTVYLLLSQQLGGPPVLAAAGAAIVVGLTSQLVARRFDVPPVLHIVVGIAPLAPGSTIYQGLLSLSQGESLAGLLTVGQAAAIGLAVAAGATLGPRRMAAPKPEADFRAPD